MTATTNNKLTSIDEFPSAVEVAKVWQQKGTQLANLGKYTAALNYLNRAITIYEDNPTALVMRAVVLIHLGQNEAALTDCDRALAINPKDKQAWLFKGVALNYLGRYEQCYASYDRALGIERRSFVYRLVQVWKGIFGVGRSDSAAMTSST
ncbi:tetratricopeptide repeat protein [Chroococcidiopsis sp. FACHB-1243]|uniref:tetratricopeptide repeat protein n=1 Tax=Chroococcidiopsis sp. [FACHB-1243] TaxID=2692781 RepID=UPI00177DFB58|nr:tetratricopeptide repeat protein [Chroococcidiopsis sp. [FACHB-1243]]